MKFKIGIFLLISMSTNIFSAEGESKEAIEEKDLTPLPTAPELTRATSYGQSIDLKSDSSHMTHYPQPSPSSSEINSPYDYHYRSGDFADLKGFMETISTECPSGWRQVACHNTNIFIHPKNNQIIQIVDPNKKCLIIYYESAGRYGAFSLDLNNEPIRYTRHAETPEETIQKWNANRTEDSVEAKNLRIIELCNGYIILISPNGTVEICYKTHERKSLTISTHDDKLINCMTQIATNMLLTVSTNGTITLWKKENINENTYEWQKKSILFTDIQGLTNIYFAGNKLIVTTENNHISLTFKINKDDKLIPVLDSCCTIL